MATPHHPPPHISRKITGNMKVQFHSDHSLQGQKQWRVCFEAHFTIPWPRKKVTKRVKMHMWAYLIIKQEGTRNAPDGPESGWFIYSSCSWWPFDVLLVYVMTGQFCSDHGGGGVSLSLSPPAAGSISSGGSLLAQCIPHHHHHTLLRPYTSQPLQTSQGVRTS